MPKEIVKNEDGSFTGVHWYNFDMTDNSEYVPPIVGVSVSTGETFTIDGKEYDALYFHFETTADLDSHIKALKRARRKAFGFNLTKFPKF